MGSFLQCYSYPWLRSLWILRMPRMLKGVSVPALAAPEPQLFLHGKSWSLQPPPGPSVTPGLHSSLCSPAVGQGPTSETPWAPGSLSQAGHTALWHWLTAPAWKWATGGDPGSPTCSPLEFPFLWHGSGRPSAQRLEPALWFFKGKNQIPYRWLSNDTVTSQVSALTSLSNWYFSISCLFLCLKYSPGHPFTYWTTRVCFPDL